MPKQWYIFVEGNDDERFFKRLISPILQNLYQYQPIIIKYREKRIEKINTFIENIKRIPYADYIFVADIDEAPCFPAKKRDIVKEIKSLEEKKIVVVIKEIESWYIAGLSDHGNEVLRIKPPDSTDDFTKEDLVNILPKGRDSLLDFKLELLKYFCMSKAKRRNLSFKYFVEKYLEPR